MSIDADEDRQFAARDVGRFVTEYGEGDLIFEQGSRGNSMFVIVDGRVRIDRDGSALSELGPGEFFGEMALVDSGTRMASAVALDDGTRLAVIDRARFIYLVSQQPAFSLTVMRVLSQRLARAQSI
jgi:CRP/FNR family transcriptional regulator, cyclic AMP receptor protein